MLDLSFLTEEEYEKLMKVLQRDAELKKKDGDRIRRIQGSIKDEKKKKFVTGEWFSEVKAKRFQEDLEGPDLLRASIRKKKGKLENEANEHIWMDSESKAAPSPTFPEHTAGTGEERSSTPTLDSAEKHKILPKPKPRLPVMLFASHKRSSIHDVSSSENDTGTSSFIAATNSLHLSRKGHEIPPLPTRLSEDAVPQSSSAARGEAVDGATSTTVGPEYPPKEIYSPSKIPVRRKPSKTFSRSEQFVNHMEPTENSNTNRKLLESPKPLATEGESNQTVKQGMNYTISSMSNREEDIGLDREHFKNLKNFWEKGADSVAMGSIPADPSRAEADGRRFKLCHSLSAQPGQGQNSKEKSGIFTKTRIPYKRTITLSSSEEEPNYVASARKDLVSVIPRSMNAKSKGDLATRSSSLNESNEKSLVPEEEKVAQRCSKKSKWPVQVPSMKTESPTKDASGSMFEPETLTNELTVAEECKHASNSLSSRVQILIEPVLTDGENDDEEEERSDLDTSDKMEINRELPEEKVCESSDKPTPGEVARERETIQGTASAVYSEHGDHSPTTQALAQANSIILAKSMVNIYTTTETYSKPHLTPHQFLEPERVKQLSRSSPLLLSETESDTASEISFQFNKHKKTPSIGSHSSDMASVSSVSGSVLSVYSGDFGSVDAQGAVEFALDYDEKNREFQVHVSQCKDLAVVDEKKGRSDPYVKTYLLPDKAKMGKRKTSVKKRTVNPVYNEVLRYKIEKMVLLIQKLNLSVWHNDPLGRNSFLGEIEVDLASWDWSNRKLNWYPLKPRSLSAVNGAYHRGVMNLSIKYVPPGSLGLKNPPSGEVHVWVKDVRDLLQLRPSGVDSFVKCYVLPDTSKKSYQKTRIIKRDTNPVFNHTIVYDGFHTEDLKDACVELTVWDHEKLTNHFLGGIRLGLGTGLSYGISVDWMDSTQEEAAFWQEMMLAANEWIEGLLPLRSLAGRKNLK